MKRSCACAIPIFISTIILRRLSSGLHVVETLTVIMTRSRRTSILYFHIIAKNEISCQRIFLNILWRHGRNLANEVFYADKTFTLKICCVELLPTLNQPVLQPVKDDFKREFARMADEPDRYCI